MRQTCECDKRDGAKCAPCSNGTERRREKGNRREDLATPPGAEPMKLANKFRLRPPLIRTTLVLVHQSGSKVLTCQDAFSKLA